MSNNPIDIELNKALSEEQKKRLLEQFMSSFQEPDKDIPKEDLNLLEKAFVRGLQLGEVLKLPNRRKYKCMAVGWKRVE